MIWNMSNFIKYVKINIYTYIADLSVSNHDV